MNRDDAAAFEETLDGLCEAMGFDAFTKAAKKIWWAAMADYSIEDFQRAAGELLRDTRQRPTIAAFRDVLSPCLHPGPEEAWNMAPKSEHEGGWVTDEILQALAACEDSLNRGDMVGARMAFVERYREAIKGKTGQPRWWLSRPIGQTEAEKTAWEEQAMLTAPASAKTANLHLGKMREALAADGTQPLLSGTEAGLRPLSERLRSIGQAKKT